MTHRCVARSNTSSTVLNRRATSSNLPPGITILRCGMRPPHCNSTRWSEGGSGLTESFDDAFAAYQKEKRSYGDPEGDWPAILAQLQAIGGRREEALLTLKREIAAASRIREGDFRPFEIAVTYAMLGDHDRALEWLAKSESVRSTNFNFVLVEPRLDGIRSDPRFIGLVKKAGFQ